MSKKLVRFAGIATLAAGLALGSASVASAHTGTDPSPSPSYTPRPVQVRHWDFDVQLSQIANINVNDVEGVGAIPMNLWVDDSLAPNLDRFRRGGNSVTLRHDPLGLANMTVNRNTCTVTFSQDGRFQIVAGTGTGAGLRSRNGEFVLQGLVSFPRIDKKHQRLNICPLRFVGDGQILRAIILNRAILGVTPSFTDFAVQGSADVFRVRPVVTPPYSGGHFAPSASPTDLPA